MDDVNDVGMNVEIMEDTPETSISALGHSFVTIEKAEKRYPSGSYRELNSMNCGETTKLIEIFENEISPYDDLSEYPELYLLEDDKLVKPGDKFESVEVFVQYLNENAKRWNYYYSCSDSRKLNTEYESYTYNCVYLRSKEKYKKKGLRKRNNNMKTNCPCQIKLRRLPNESELTVVEVCNYHDHELSAEQFSKLQHGRRLPPYVKEEIMDLLALQVNKRKIRNYVEMETGFRMGHPFFYALEKNMKKSGTEREITEKRLQLLTEKLSAVDEMYGYNDAEHSEHNEQDVEDLESPHKSKLKKISINKNRKKVSQTNNKPSKTADEVSSTTFTDKIKITSNSEVTCSETLQSVKNLQELVKCEIQKNPWVSDQYLPVLPNRIAVVENFPETHSETQEEEQENETESYIEYYNPDDHTQESTKTVLCERNGFMVAPEVQNDTENITYETVVMDENEVLNNETHYVIHDNDIVQDQIAINSDAQEDNVVHLELQNNEDISEVQYITEDNEHLVDFINQTNEEIAGHDVGVQTNSNKGTDQTLLPVFDVYMKDGNVMGFVVNNNAINELKGGVDEGIQTSEDIIYSDIQEIENEDSEIIETSNDQNKGTYTKHEYVHRYNLEQYMTQPHFPRYVEILAKETQMDVLNMFTNVYNEKAMFKLTTTQKGNEGNTRIRYITHNGKIRKRKMDDAKREKFGRNLQSIFILKEKMRMLKKKNEDLIKRNEYLQEVALKLVNLG